MNFSSPALQNAFNKAKPILENIAQTKNVVSEEIKFLEKFLQDQAISDNFSFQVRSPSFPGSLEMTEEGVFTNEELLIWDKEKKRIMYQHNQYTASSSVHDGRVTFSGDYISVVVNKPLIETSFEIRKKIYESFLSHFLLDITSKYELAKKDINETCPF